MSPDLICILSASFGALCQEVLHWYNLRNKLEKADMHALEMSKWYWIVISATIFVSGLGTYFLFFQQAPKSQAIQFILGAAFPNIFKKLVERESNNDHFLGNEQLRLSDTLKMYFR